MPTFERRQAVRVLLLPGPSPLSAPSCPGEGWEGAAGGRGTGGLSGQRQRRRWRRSGRRWLCRGAIRACRWVCFGCGSRLGVDQAADFYAVVGEDPVSAPGSGAADAVHEAATPAEVAFQARDTTLAAGAPLDQLDETGATLDDPAGRALTAFADDGDLLDAEVLHVGGDLGVAVAPVGGHRPRGPADQFFDPGDGGGEQGTVGRVADQLLVVQHDAIDVVDHVG